MKKILLLVFGFALLTFQSNAQFGGILKKAKTAVLGEDTGDVGPGIKEALANGTNSAVESLAKENGFLDGPYKILIPEDAQKVVSTVSKVPGFQNVEKDLVAKMNAAAEIAMKKAGPIFLDAIKQMTFKDAMNLLMGEQDAATRYLEKTSRNNLYQEFMPVIQSALDEVNAREYWSSAVNAYNKIPFKKKMNPELDDHVNQSALDGVFSLIEEKELGIRSDTNLRTSPLLEKVFAMQDKK